jgi:MFS family permease
VVVCHLAAFIVLYSSRVVNQNKRRLTMSSLLNQQAERVGSPLRRPAFLRLWLGLMFSRMGDQFTLVALIWFVLQLTGSGIAIGLVVLCFQLPTIISSPLMGLFLDRYQPRVVIAVDNLGRACIIAAIPILFWSATLQLWMIYVLALCAGFLSPATEVGMRIIIPRLVPDAELERANSLSAISWDFSTLVGPAIAGFLIVFISAPSILVIDAASFFFMAAMVLSAPSLSQQAADAEAARDDKQRRNLFGFGTILSMKSVLMLVVLTLLFLFAHGLMEVALPVYSQKVLAAGSIGYGLLMSASSVGSLLALVFISHLWARFRRPGMTLAFILLLIGMTLIPLLFIHTLLLALIVISLVGLAASPYPVVEQSLMQRLVPERVRGQVFGARGALSVAGYPLGGAISGVLLGIIGAPLTIGVSALLCIIMATACFLSPTMRNMHASS